MARPKKAVVEFKKLSEGFNSHDGSEALIAKKENGESYTVITRERAYKLVMGFPNFAEWAKTYKKPVGKAASKAKAEKPSKICPKCEHKNSEGAIYCNGCSVNMDEYQA